ncbi:MAG TPA: hypothetical protein VL574_01160 [Stellaceae bacterium]|nr:hypothetical protein [Stellaceae bacterium]
MKHLILTAAIAGTTMLWAADASAGWQRHGSHVGRFGRSYSTSASGGCSGGTCSRSRSLTGPAGRTVSESGSISHTGPGDYNWNRTVTGPEGGTVTRSGSTTYTP